MTAFVIGSCTCSMGTQLLPPSEAGPVTMWFATHNPSWSSDSNHSAQWSAFVLWISCEYLFLACQNASCTRSPSTACLSYDFLTSFSFSFFSSAKYFDHQHFKYGLGLDIGTCSMMAALIVRSSCLIVVWNWAIVVSSYSSGNTESPASSALWKSSHSVNL